MTNFIKSLKRNYIGIIFMTLSASSLAIGQLLWKISASKDSTLLFGGFIIYGMGAVLMITAYRYGSLSVLHPMMSISYILAFLLGFRFLDEKLSAVKILGLIIIIIGCILIGGGDDN
jgi:undecaprenyl phosphate-alpha-L-ara4N flippase subunit ArnE